MASLKALKLRIASIKSTQKITKAMKMVAAAKLRRSQEAAEAARPYSERMAAVMASLGSRVVVGPESPRLLTGTGADQTYLLVVVTSERGLAGGFNTNIVRLARRRADELTGQGKTVKLLLAGRKGRAAFVRTHREAISTRSTSSTASARRSPTRRRSRRRSSTASTAANSTGPNCSSPPSARRSSRSRRASS